MSDSHDFIARFADAWDGVGHNVFTPPTHQEALLRLAWLSTELSGVPWRSLSGEQRQKLLFAARASAELGSICSWMLGR